MLIFWPISSLGDAYKRYLSDAYKKKHVSRVSNIDIVLVENLRFFMN